MVLEPLRDMGIKKGTKVNREANCGTRSLELVIRSLDLQHSFSRIAVINLIYTTRSFGLQFVPSICTSRSLGLQFVPSI